MPRKRNNQEPPEVMTWPKVLPVLIVCAVFDAVRFMFEQFWFFGPALVGIGTSMALGGGVIGTAAGAVAGGAAGFFGSAGFEVFGIIMAMAEGFIGWLTIGLWTLVSNPRIFKANANGSLWLLFSLAVSEVPIVGSAPALTLTMSKLYHTQIQKEKAALKKYKEAQSAAQLQERRQQKAEQQAQFIQTQAAGLASAEVY